ncbi:MAG: hypothetical protein HY790_10625 [Deltaproteobacteria bacterium]|nr:hypothetical protein [Deltaproteobacteria bacterium]MBI4796268.1 hypothetical protein [Deltaproteobacteria bacterium]
MAGRIKAGEGGLIGSAGEFYVMAELLKRGVIAGLLPRNTRSFDILATKNNCNVRIRVKTKSQEYSDWQWVIKKDNSIFRDLSDDGDFIVLVDLSMDTKDIKFYIMPTKQVDEMLRNDHNEWLNTPGKNGRPHDPKNKKRHLSQIKHAKELSTFLNNWDKLWKISQPAK